MTKVAILWHMHQPFYQDLLTGEHILPWVRLHGVKDYYGMPALLREFPDVKVTFNLVPSLLTQLEAFAADEARDRWLVVGMKPADSLTEDERRFLIAEGFHAQRTRMIEPYPRYAELLARRDGAKGAAWRAFSDADFRDLQVWLTLAWMDPSAMAGDARVRRLVAKGRDFTEEDKELLRQAELDLLRRVIPEYTAAAARGQAELSTSAFYHPILPLLCDTDIYLRTHPHARVPRQRFRHPEDASLQLERAVAYHERKFGSRPAGLWPPEGSVSEAVVPLAAAAGFRWMATDELILARSLGTSLARGGDGQLEQPEILYRPYVVRAGGAEIACLFRDHTLSDLIGFTYASWDPQAAAQDLLSRLADAGRRFAARTGGGEAVITLVLDGENAWEHYADQGRPFLRALYGGLSRHPDLKTVTMEEAAAGATAALPELFPGSWIDGNFYIWIGHPDDQRAWSQLADARQALDAPGPAAGPADVERARDELLIAEGSDWFWWYGDDHSSAHDLAFDDLFRRHLRNAYRALDKPIPEELFVTNITTAPPKTTVHPPSAELQPRLDGEVSSYFEWLGAGELELGGPGGAMHQVSGRALLRGFRFGFGEGRLYLRLDFARRAQDFLGDAGEIRLSFTGRSKVRLTVVADTGVPVVRVSELVGTEWVQRPDPRATAAAGRVLELSVPLDVLTAEPDQTLTVSVALIQGGHEVERHPAHRPAELTVPAADFRARYWSV